MIRWAALLGLGLAACSPQPRDAAWFQAHPDAAAGVVAQCAAGARKPDCANARTGLSRGRAAARQERYRRGFE